LAQSFIGPDRPAPLNVRAIQTTQIGGMSLSPYDSLNVGDHVNNLALHVAHNRQLLSSFVPAEPVWMNQMHGARVLDATKNSRVESADAAKFFSFRRRGDTGRIATLIWLESKANT